MCIVDVGRVSHCPLSPEYDLDVARALAAAEHLGQITVWSTVEYVDGIKPEILHQTLTHNVVLIFWLPNTCRTAETGAHGRQWAADITFVA